MRLESSKQKQKRLRKVKRQGLKKKIRKDVVEERLPRLPERFRGSICFSCPSVLSLDNNFDESVRFFQNLKTLSVHIKRRRQYRPTSPIRYSISMDNLERVSVRCAVILAAEIDRLRRTAGNVLVYQGGVESDSEPVSLLRQLGMFELLGSRARLNGGNEKAVVVGQMTAIPIMTGINCDEERFLDFERAVRGILDDFEPTDFMHSGMAEAMLNATNHAYLSRYPLRYPSSGKRWWAAAVLDGERSELKVLIFDQGHGIAKTLPSSGLLERIELTASKLLGKLVRSLETPEEILVRAALESARTRTNEDERGKGFNDIQAPLSEVPGSRLRITSGRAEVTMKDGAATVSSPLQHHIGGTLIEWVFPVQSVQSHDKEASE